MFREITNEIGSAAALIWEREKKLPRFFRNAKSVYTRDFADYLAFLSECSHIYGFFCDGYLYAVVYCEPKKKRHLTIHLSVLKYRAEFQKDAGDLRNYLLHTGVTRITGWILTKNRSLSAIVHSIGFRDTDLRMKSGFSHGRFLTWKFIELGAA